MGERMTDAERWWPHLSIEAKHEILADPAAPLSERARAEIADRIGAEAPERLGAADVEFIETQIEAVD